MPQFIIKSQDLSGSFFAVSGEEAHHLIRTLRKGVNDEIDFSDGQGNQYRGVITQIDQNALTAKGRVLLKHHSPENPFRIHLYQGLPKSSKFDFVVEKATELGATSICPFLSQKNIIKSDDRRGQTKQERWARLAKAACKQSGRTRFPRVEAPRPLADYRDQFQQFPTLILDPGEGGMTLAEVLKDRALLSGDINVVIGPESGFHRKEIEWLQEGGGTVVKMEGLILRAETAGLVILSILNYENSR
ncbi:hypothetical protein BVX98_02875 [bacterium F11]|nr:hypothetical protein BVX98_02875 [bacterium F11]